METKILKIIAHSIFSSYRTYEEWKRGLPTWFQLSIKRFLPYLWGMETLSVSNILLYRVDRSYRTYEEWKQQMDAHNIPGAGRVLTVPMRNGNPEASETIQPRSTKFLPYLWGMETWEWQVKNIPVRSFLPYLWGMETCTRSVGTVRNRFAFLPYLWGMETRYRIFLRWFL